MEPTCDAAGLGCRWLGGICSLTAATAQQSPPHSVQGAAACVAFGCKCVVDIMLACPLSVVSTLGMVDGSLSLWPPLWFTCDCMCNMVLHHGGNSSRTEGFNCQVCTNRSSIHREEQLLSQSILPFTAMQPAQHTKRA